jgi:hypothetical protein
MYPQQVELQRKADEWRFTLLDDIGEPVRNSGVCRKPVSGSEHIEINQDESTVKVTLNGRPVCVVALPATDGRLQLVAERDSVLRVKRFEVQGTPVHSKEFWLATEGLTGAATGMNDSEWRRVDDVHFRYGFGYLSVRPGACAKWNYQGGGFRLHAPRGPAYGKAEISVDGQEVAIVDLRSEENQPSGIVFTHTLPPGFHAVMLRAAEGVIPCDVLETMSETALETD